MRGPAPTNPVASRALRVGNMLMQGPKALFPRAGDGDLWLDPALTVRWHSETQTVWRSMHVFTDGNGSDEEGFLPPVVRFATWERASDMTSRDVRWPSLSVALSVLPWDSAELQAAVTRVQEAVASAPFEARGLATRRDFGASPSFREGELTVMLTSGWEVLERVLAVASAPAAFEACKALEAELRRLALPEARGNWTEMYERGPDQLVDEPSWFWEGQPESVDVIVG